MKINKIFKKQDKKIIFQSAEKHSDLFPNMPEPMYKNVPVWYKQQKLFSNSENNLVNAHKKVFLENKHFQSTYKLCTPLVDTITSGYAIKTSADILVVNTSKDSYVPRIIWNVSWNMLDKQDNEVLGNYPIPVGHHNEIFRWHVHHKIITPKDYSLWITHPSHRYDLPFTTINGFVDTDKHPNQLFLPFFIKEGFEGTIPQNTVIAQLIPVKRENWFSENTKYDNSFEEYAFDNVRTNIIRTYKNKFWERKNYK